MVVQVHLDAGVGEAGGEVADPLGRPGVDDNQGIDPGQVDIFGLLKFIAVKQGLRDEFPDVFFLRSGKGQQGVGIELLGGNHRGQAVEISVQVRGDDAHRRRSQAGC